MNKGYIHVYTGDGKGKTTAAFGLAIRAALSGKSVYIGQFVKDMKYNETKISNYIKNIKIEQFGNGCFIDRLPNESDIFEANTALSKCKDILEKGAYDLVILDEVTIALYFKLFSIDDLLKVIKLRKENIEVIITGRYAPKELIDMADLVTEMKEIKHYYNTQGVEAREGIER